MQYNIIRLPEVIEKTGLSRSTIYRKVANSTFPSPLRLSDRAIGWSRVSVESYIESRAQLARITAGFTAERIEETVEAHIERIGITQPLQERERLLAVLHAAYQHRVPLTQVDVEPICKDLRPVVVSINDELKVYMQEVWTTRNGKDVPGYQLLSPEDYAKAEILLYALSDGRK